jgi:RES domain-containing protein
LLTVYRIVKARHARSVLSAEGARVSRGRWHLPGQSVVYTSGSLALAAIETFVHLEEDGLRARFVYFRIEIAHSVAIERPRRLPRNWRAEPPEFGSMNYGSTRLRGLRSAVLEVPSAIVPSEKNYLLNPGHADFRKIRAARAVRFTFDPRMWK